MADAPVVSERERRAPRRARMTVARRRLVVRFRAPRAHARCAHAARARGARAARAHAPAGRAAGRPRRRRGRRRAARRAGPLALDRAEIDEGLALLDDALAHDRAGPYQLQAAIAGCHAAAAHPQDTDWPRIAQLYGRLAEIAPSPVVDLNRAVAVAMADGRAAALPLVEALEASGELAGYHLLPATRADFLRRLGRRAEAAAAYREALDLVANDAERRFLQRRVRETGGDG
jgi:tetratricopeptide (TPR) repeat protein